MIERIKLYLSETKTELKKVTWPSGNEVKVSTKVVVIMTVISAVILGLLDMLWSTVTESIYG